MPASVQEIVVPYLGAAVAEGVVTRWLKVVGETVAQGEPVCEIATDKVDMEVEAPADGVLVRIMVAEEEAAEIGAALAELGPPGSVPPAPGNEASAGEEEPAPAEEFEISGEVAEPAMIEYLETGAGAEASPGRPGSRHSSALAPGRFDPAAVAESAVAVSRRDNGPLASPLARRIAAENGLRLERIAGSGLRGRISKADVLRVLEDPGPRQAPAREGARSASSATPPAVAGDVPPGYEDVACEAVSLTRLRRSIAEHMVRSRHTAAHVTTVVEVDMSTAEQARAQINSKREAAGRRRLSLLPFVGRAAAATLVEFPDLNATFTEDRILRWREVNLGIAVDAGQGLLVPVVRGADRLTVEALGEAIAETAGNVRDGKIAPDDLAGGTFTITNVGPMGAVVVAPTINQPQVAILGMPAIVKRPLVVAGPGGEELIAIRPTIQLSLTFDHRAIDGAEATRGAAAIKDRLEGWGPEGYG